MKRFWLPIICSISILLNIILTCIVLANKPFEYKAYAVMQFFDDAPSKYDTSTVDMQTVASMAQNAWATRLKGKTGTLREPISGEEIVVRHYYKMDLWTANGTIPAVDSDDVPWAIITSSGKVIAVYYASDNAEGGSA